MAASKSSAPSSLSTRDESLTCPLCLETFRTPKILPCLHTFCECCLKDLVHNHPAGTFPCPSCRQEVQLPSGGVSAFRNNFYIKPEDLDKARNSNVCGKHPQKELEVYCGECDFLVCVICLIDKHKSHDVKFISEAIEDFKTQLGKHKSRLDDCVDTVKKNAAEKLKNVLQELKDKKSLVKDAILNRHATLQTALDKCRDDALTSLDNITDEIEKELRANPDCQQEKLQKLARLKHRVQQAVDRGAGCELMTVAREMRCGRGSQEAVQKLTTKQMTTVCRPVLRFSATFGSTLEHMRDYMGSAAKMKMVVSPPEVTVMEQFRCREDPDTDVCFVCPMTDGKVWVSHEPNMTREGATSEEFSTDGKLVSISTVDVRERKTYAPLKDGSCMYPIPTPGTLATYAKKTEPHLTRFFRLNNDLTGQATVFNTKILSNEPLETEWTTEFKIKCAAHRAVDVDASEQLFVVLEEAQVQDLQRTVRLYRRPQSDAIATYSPPVAPFQPSDVCFYTLGGHEVLLVADELNDAIHLVNVQDGRLSFARYLAPGCPLLVQPTALNTDTRGRLWVACRGGRILTCEPIN
ncbi:hypothetical protein BaRGS_00029697 [Batillaria attramentaria]|uniref:Uncharacterized protein n=1 Tax=Batillaria attramentaria TaxID=370345 RepID=A0ABD0JWK0_9CAEN